MPSLLAVSVCVLIKRFKNERPAKDNRYYVDNAFGSACTSVRVRNSKTIDPIDLVFVHKKYNTSGSALL